MKALNILSVLFFLLVATACSSESDTIMNDIDKEVETASERIAMFDFAFAGEEGQTRAAELTIGTEAAISNCFIAALDENDKVLTSFFYKNDALIQNGNTTTINDHMIIKVPANKLPALRFFAVANLNPDSQNQLLQCTHLTTIKEVVLDENPTVLVKTGISKSITQYSTSESTKGNIESTKITIPVYQRAAAVELAEFKVRDANKNDMNAEIVSLQLLNVKMNAKVEGEADITNFASSEISNKNDARFYTYDNTSEDYKTSLKVTYMVNGVSYDRTYTIKTPEKGEVVVGGNLYQLHVTITHVSEDAHFEVLDWTPNTINLGDIEGTLN